MRKLRHPAAYMLCDSAPPTGGMPPPGSQAGSWTPRPEVNGFAATAVEPNSFGITLIELDAVGPRREIQGGAIHCSLRYQLRTPHDPIAHRDRLA